MSSTRSLLQTLQQEQPQLRSQIYFKSALTALSHALEDIVLAKSDRPLVIANFQQERYYRPEVRRYERIGRKTDQVYVLAAPERESGFAVTSKLYEAIPLSSLDDLAQEWHLIILGSGYAACLICREQPQPFVIDAARRFEGFWSFDRPTCSRAAQWLLEQVVERRPELKSKVKKALNTYGLTLPEIQIPSLVSDLTDSSIFGQRLMTYLQASQYKLLKAYRVLDEQSQRERLINVMTTAIRRSLDPTSVLNTAITELGQVFPQSRCLLYRCQSTDAEVMIEHEGMPEGIRSLLGQSWPLRNNAIIQVALSQERATVISNVAEAPITKSHPRLQSIIEPLQIYSWLLVPIQYQGTVLGMIELHHGDAPHQWRDSEVALVEALATQVGVALTQADLFSQSAALNQQLQALERTQSNLINIVGHELRTPLSTIQVCLESLESEPSMAIDMRQVMLETALSDAERMRKLISDFLLLSRLESQPTGAPAEPIQLQEALTLAISGITASGAEQLPDLHSELPANLPPLNTDGNGLVELLTKLIDNAFKFTPADGQVIVSAQVQSFDAEPDQLLVSIADTGCGIQPEQLQTIFDAFYQEEDYLQRSVGGTGLGLSICRQIIKTMKGEIWAKSDGKDQGSTIYLRLPLD